MTMTIGRAGLSTPTLAEVHRWDAAGERVSVSGAAAAATIADVKVLRQQLLGHVDNPDEAVVPVTWSDDPTADGFYRVIGADVQGPPGSGSYGRFPFAVELERVPGYAAPLAEAVLLGATRTNEHSLAPLMFWWAVPNEAEGIIAPAIISFDHTTRLYNPGDDTAAQLRVIVHTTLSERVTSYWLAPGDWYRAAATLSYDGRTVVGHQAGSDPTKWQLSNGACRIRPDDSNPQRILYEAWDGTSWDAKTFKIGTGTTGGSYSADIAAPHTWAVLRNSPEEVAIRLAFAHSSRRRGQLDLRLRRGALIVEAFIKAAGSNSGFEPGWAVGVATTEAGTEITGGLRATSNDGGGNRYLLTAPKGFNAGTAAGHIVDDDNPRLNAFNDFGFGLVVGGSAATDANTAAALVDQYHSPVTEKLTTVGR